MAAIIDRLAWLGRQGTRAIALSVLLGLVMPPVSAFLRQGLEVTVFMLLVLAFLRVDQTAVRRRIKQPKLVIAACLWVMIALPVIGVVAAFALGLDAHPDIMLILLIFLGGPAITASPAFSYLMGLDGALSLTVLVIVTVMTPVTAPVIASIVSDGSVSLSAVELAIRLFALLAGSSALATLIRRLAGPDRMLSHNAAIDGINVVVLTLFAVAAMDGVTLRLLQDPLLVLVVLLASYAVALAAMALTMVAFAAIDRADAFTIAISSGNRNMGLIVAALGGTIPELTWLYFALGQFPIYTLPYMLQPIARRLLRDQASG